MNDFLDEKRREITERLKELKPLRGRVQPSRGGRVGARGRCRNGSLRRRCRDHGAARTRPPAGHPRAQKSDRSDDPQRHRHPHHENPQESQKSAAKPTATATARKPGRPAKRRAGRRKGSGTRAAEALSFVQGQPGITIPELAAKMGIKQNYLYRVLPGLESEKKVEKKDRGWYPRG